MQSRRMAQQFVADRAEALASCRSDVQAVQGLKGNELRVFPHTASSFRSAKQASALVLSLLIGLADAYGWAVDTTGWEGWPGEGEPRRVGADGWPVDENGWPEEDTWATENRVYDNDYSELEDVDPYGDWGVDDYDDDEEEDETAMSRATWQLYGDAGPPDGE